MGEVDAQDYIYTLVNNLVSSYGISSERIKIDLNLESIALDVDTAIPCGLIINELVSNCFKYAFFGRSTGTVNVYFTQVDPSKISFGVEDNGRGLPEDFDLEQINSLGLQLVQNLVEQLEGELTIMGNQGTQIKITFPWIHNQKADQNDEFNQNISS
jgi:two-component sensor histidine kinase